ncbi:recombinase RecT [Lysobacter sp. F6437]|uniref:recombinase RecT n=1 Tax=Lysobacter sp. F6437 TaxID=3459296 RepID=UPI00403D5A76
MSNIVPFHDLQGMAQAVAASNLFGMKNTEQALALMLVAQAEGQHPATITQDYDIIQGKATRKTHSVLARFQQMGGQVEWHELTDLIADATFSHKAGGKLRMTWTFEQAAKAKLTGKDNWKNYPRAMLRARCIAEGIRAVYPAALGGMMVSEEAQDTAAAEQPITVEARVVSERAAELPMYPEADFAENLPKWWGVIASGKKSADDLIAMLQTKARFTAEQLHEIRNPPRDENEAAGAEQEAQA